VSAVKLLLQNQADVNASWVVPEVGVVLTPLSLAAFRGQQDIVTLLVEAGAKINAISKVSDTFL
jgi:ankyrin repeat protein